MSRFFDVATEFFESDNWTVHLIRDESMYRMGFRGDNGRWECALRVREEEQQIIFYSILDVLVPRERRTVMAEFMAMVNFGLFIGNFELDMSDGEIRFKTGVDLSDNEDLVNTATIRKLVYTNVSMMDHYYPGLMGVAYAGLTPSQALLEAEGDPRP